MLSKSSGSQEPPEQYLQIPRRGEGGEKEKRSHNKEESKNVNIARVTPRDLSKSSSGAPTGMMLQCLHWS